MINELVMLMSTAGFEPQTHCLQSRYASHYTNKESPRGATFWFAKAQNNLCFHARSVLSMAEVSGMKWRRFYKTRTKSLTNLMLILAFEMTY